MDQKRNRQGDQQSQHAKQLAPDGQGQEDHGRVEPGRLAHDPGNQYGVLDDLYDDEHGDHEAQHNPDTLTRAQGPGDCEQHGRDETHDLQVGHHVEQSDKKPQQDPHRQSDQPEPQREEQADDEGDQGLGTEVDTHGLREVRNHVKHHRLVLFRNQVLPSFRDLVEIQQDEDQVQHDDDHDRESDHEADGTRKHAPYAGQNLLYKHPDVFEVEQLNKLFDAHEVRDVDPDFLGNIGLQSGLPLIRVHQPGQQILHLRDLGRDHGDQDRKEQYHGAENDRQAQQHGHDPGLYGQFSLQPGGERIDQIGEQQSDGEGDEHVAQVGDEGDQQPDHRHGDGDADYPVECKGAVGQHMHDPVRFAYRDKSQCNQVGVRQGDVKQIWGDGLSLDLPSPASLY